MVLLVALAFGLAGCAAPHADPCKTTACPTDPTPSSSPGTTPTVSPGPIKIGLPVFAFDNCTGVSLSTEIPADVASQHVPGAFVPSSPVPFFGRLGFTALDCPRVVYKNHTYENIFTIWSGLLVAPSNETWTKDGFSIYTYDVLISNQTIASEMTSAGIPAFAATFARTFVPSSGAFLNEAWEIVSQGPSYKINVEYAASPQTAEHPATVYNWFGTGPYERVIIDQHDRLAGPGIHSGTLQITGSSGFHDALGQDAAPLEGSALSFIKWVMQKDPAEFKA